jgi:hypothetical protein
MADTSHAESALAAVRAQVTPPVPFNQMFVRVTFQPGTGANAAAFNASREELMTNALGFFARETTPPVMKHGFRFRSKDTTEPSNNAPADGNMVVYLPYCDFSADQKVKKSADGVAKYYLRKEIAKGDLQALMSKGIYVSYFAQLEHLGTPKDNKPWVWLTRCIAPDTYIMLPFQGGLHATLESELKVVDINKRYMFAQSKTENANGLVSPDSLMTGDQNKAFWAMTIGTTPELDPPRLSGLAESIPSRMKELDLSDAMDEAVQAGQKVKFTVLSNGYSSETQPPPAPDKPSAFAEVAGAVIVAGAVALTTGIIASI